ncbi:MAG: MbnP family protein [Bacteroidota bacterium]
MMVILLSSCYENQEGCLDIGAANFDIDADIACEDCCELPELRLSIQHNFSLPDTNASIRFNIDSSSFYTVDDSMSFFQLSEVRFYLSDIKMEKPNGDAFGVENRVSLFKLANSDTIDISIPDNFALINRQNISTRDVGVINTDGNFSQLNFRIGLPEDTRNLLPSKLPDDHPLELGDSTLYNFERGEYEVVSLTLIRPALSDTLSINILESEWQAEVELVSDFMILTGFDATIALGVDYRIWWENLDINTATVEQIKEHLKERIPESFELLEVR